MKKMRLPFLIISLVLAAFLCNGCDMGGFTPNLPGGVYDEVNTEIAYFKVLPAKIEMKINQSQKFEVKAYNSDNKEVRIDLSQLEWQGGYQCYECGVVWKIAPTRNSLQTVFTPLEKGKFVVWIKYNGEFKEKADVIVK